MEVKVTGQGRGAVHAAPRPGSGPQASARSGATSRPAAAATASAPATAALFDANGDGVIENWSIAYGGDSFANFDPPPSGSYGADATKTHHATDAARQSADAKPDLTGQARGQGRAMHTTTPAAISHARDAYQRDGAANAPAANTAPVAQAPVAQPPIPTPVAAPATTPVTQPPGPAPLRSAGS